MQKISIVIPVYGQWHLAKRNIDSLLKFDRERIEEIILVDDCSPKSNPYQFDDKIVRVIKNNVNLGYTGSVNNGLRQAVCEIIMLLDSDAYLIKPVVADVIEMYEKDPLLACVGYRTVDDNGNLTGSFCYEPIALGLIAGQKLEYKLEQLHLFNKRNIMPYSCSVSFRNQSLKEMDYFDQQQFPVLDADLDLSMRIHRSKWKLLFNEQIILSHSGGNSYKINYKRVLLFYKSRWKLLRKHNLIKFPHLTKTLIQARLNVELFILTVLCFVKWNDPQIREKKNGRKIILQEVALYNTQ
jgi:GT2 family glycosyltransferase